jgi:hypothetical protein
MLARHPPPTIYAGFFRRAASAINQADPVSSAVMALSPSIRRVDRLLANGVAANVVITGVRFSLNDGTVRKELAMSVQTASGWPVVVKLDGERGCALEAS